MRFLSVSRCPTLEDRRWDYPQGTVAVGAGLWLLAFLLLLPFYGRLAAQHRMWWLWTCLAGFGLGVWGWDYCRRRRNRRLQR